jgi:hypothetical protein
MLRPKLRGEEVWSKDLASLHYFDPSVFVASSKADEMVCGFALALALHANDAKVLLGLTNAMIDQSPKFEKICEEMGEYFGQKSYLHRLTFSQLHELHFIFAERRYMYVSTHPLFKETLENMTPASRRDWDALVEMSLDKRNAVFMWFKGLRDGLGFHYIQFRKLSHWFRKWTGQLKPGGTAATQEGAYISIGRSVKTTRYYFADAAVSEWMGEEFKNRPLDLKALGDLMNRNVNAISGFIGGFITARGGKLVQSKYPPLTV